MINIIAAIIVVWFGYHYYQEIDKRLEVLEKKVLIKSDWENTSWENTSWHDNNSK